MRIDRVSAGWWRWHPPSFLGGRVVRGPGRIAATNIRRRYLGRLTIGKRASRPLPVMCRRLFEMAADYLLARLVVIVPFPQNLLLVNARIMIT